MVYQRSGVLAVDLTAFALPIRSVRTADFGAFVPCKSKPVKASQNGRFGLRGAACGIRILDAQNEFTAVLFGKAIVEESNVRGTDMRIASWRRSNTGSNS